MNDKMEYLISSTLIRVSEDSDFIHLYHDLVEEYERNLTRESDIVEGEKNGSPDTVTTGSDNELFVDVMERNSKNSSRPNTGHVSRATPSLRRRQRRLTAISGEWYRRVCLHDFDGIDNETANFGVVGDERVSKKRKDAARLKDYFPGEELENSKAVDMERKATKIQSRLNAMGKSNIETSSESLKSSETVRCNTCRKSFKTVQGLGAHMRTHLRHICLACGETFPKRAGLAHHQPVHSDRPHLCKLCGNSFKTLECLQLHKTSTHEFKCSECNKTFERQSMLSWHITRAHTYKSLHLTCDVCGRSFRSKFRLDDHKNIHKGEKPYECKVCQKRFPLRDSLNEHKRIHVPESERPHGCQLCSRGFWDKRDLLSHVRAQHECKVCQKRFPLRDSLNEHKRIHVPESERPHSCQLCSRGFWDKRDLLSHVRAQHEKQKKSKVGNPKPKIQRLNPVIPDCPSCGKNLPSRTALKEHMSEPHICKTCGNILKNVIKLRRHEKIHIGAKPFQCTYCDKTFAYRYHCKSHEAIHDKSLRLSCDTCGRTFGRSGDLNRHKKIHSQGSYPFNCKLCGKGFDTERQRKDHKNEHTGSTPYECDVCTWKFSSRDSMQEHKKSHIQFQCQHCDKGFHHTKKLFDHIKKCHVLAWRVKERCAICWMGFTDKSELENHCAGHVVDTTIENLKVEDI